MTDSEAPILNIVGERVALGPLHRERMLALDLKRANDFAVTVYHGQNPHPVTEEMVAARYERITHSPNELWFFIYERASLRPIGYTYFSDMNRVHRTAEFNISIGATDCWGKGYGTETTQLMLTYAFDVLGFHVIWLRVIGTNERAIRAYHRAGFQDAGRLREAHRIGQQAYDLLYMECLAREYQRPVPRST
jgi:RimJ/RimL family protein N-acetyltransferase